MNRHINAPIYDALLKIRKHHHSLHVPGHKLGHDFDAAGLHSFRTILEMDQTEIEGLDDLHHAEGIIRDAEQLASEAFGSEETKFLVGGTTSGILALILAVIGEGDKCLIERNAHKSVFNGLRLARGTPVYLAPNFEANTQLPLGVQPNYVEKALRMDSSIKAVLITSPNYYGQTANIAKIAEITQRYGIPLLVDEAHGAHYRFASALPSTALEQGADAVVQSTHKTLPAMTMGSMLHFQGERLDRQQVKRWLATIQSSSPSYPILSSLDLARRHMVVGDGVRKLEQAIQHAQSLRVELQSVPWLQIAPTADPLRFVMLHPHGWSRSLQQHLQVNGIYPEIVEPDRIVFIFSGGNSYDDFKSLKEAIHSFKPPAVFDPIKKNRLIPEHLWMQAQSDRIDLKQSTWCTLESAVSRVAAQMIIPYPPGIPFVLERQILSIEVLDVLQNMLKEGIHLHGVENKRILVYE